MSVPTRQHIPANVAHLPITNQELESSFHHRSAVDLSAWLIPASFRPAPESHHQHRGHHTEEGVLRVAPKKFLSSFEPRTNSINSWQSDLMWLIGFTLFFSFVYFFCVRGLIWGEEVPIAWGLFDGIIFERGNLQQQQQQQSYRQFSGSSDSDHQHQQFHHQQQYHQQQVDEEVFIVN